jgi:hypothetical protein
MAAAAAEAGYDLDAVAGRRIHTHAPSNGSRLSSTRAGTRPAMDDPWRIHLGCCTSLSYWA